MAAIQLRWGGDDEEPDPAFLAPKAARRRPRPGELPPEVAAALWRGNQLGSPVTNVLSSGFAALDAELPGSGWPCQSLTEVLQPQASVAEWRLLAPVMQAAIAKGGHIVVVGPPKHPHLPGLKLIGLDERHLTWVQAEAPAERLWVTEQLIKANAAGVLVAWLPQARQEQIRRLQVCAQSCDGPVFLCRPIAAKDEPSAAPLRAELRFGLDWHLHVRLLKRKGATHEGVLELPSVPGGLASILTPRLRLPSAILFERDHARTNALELRHALGSTAPQPAIIGRIPAH